MAVPTVARPYQHPGAAALGVPGHAGRIIASLGGQVETFDAGDDAGVLMMGDVADGDLSEIHALLRAVLGLDGAVLDLAPCAGRLTVPLLALGLRVTAVDRSPGVLEAVSRRVALGPRSHRPSFTAVRADPCSLSLDRRFGAIVHASATLGGLEPAARAALFAAARRHLAPGGRLVLTTLDHGAENLPVEVERVVAAPSGRAYRVHEYWEPGAPTWRLTILPIEHVPGAVTTTRLRVLPAAALVREVEAAGLEVVARRRLADGGPRHPQVLLEAAVPAEPTMADLLDPSR